MKILILVCGFVVGFCSGQPALENGDRNYEIKKINLTIDDIATKETIEKVSNAYVNGIFDIEINALFDGLLDLLREQILENGIDPLQMENQKLDLLGILGSVDLTSGSLQDISTIKRDDDVVISYHTSTKQISFLLPLGFEELAFHYQYKTRITLLTFTGGVEGKIKDVKLNIKITYDPNTQTLSLDDLNLKNSGRVSVKYTGNILLDWLTNALTAVVTTVLQPIIILVVQGVVQSIGNEVVDAVNQYLQG